MKCLVDSIERSSWTLLPVAQTPLIRSLGRRKLRSTWSSRAQLMSFLAATPAAYEHRAPKKENCHPRKTKEKL